MAVKTFTNEQLTASDTNTYLANAGLVYVTSTTVGTGVSNVTVSNCFTSTYDNYRIIYFGGSCSSDAAISFALGSSTTAYYGGWNRADNAAATTNLGANNTGSWPYAGMASTDGTTLEMDLFGPNLAKFTLARMSWLDTRTSNAWGNGGGVHRVATAYTSFVITPSAGTLTGGTITVYGYRKA